MVKFNTVAEGVVIFNPLYIVKISRIDDSKSSLTLKNGENVHIHHSLSQAYELIKLTSQEFKS